MEEKTFEKVWRALSVIICIALVVLPPVIMSALHKPSQEELEERAVHEHEIYCEGFDAAIWELANYAESEFDDVCDEIYDRYRIDAETAADTLLKFANGEPVSQADLLAASNAMGEYFWELREFVYSIDDFER